MHKSLKVILISAFWLLAVSSVTAMTYCMPTPSRMVNSSFGARWGRQHKGLDIKVNLGDTIRAAFSGEIVKSSFNKAGYGNYVIIRHEKGMETLYAHLSKNLVSEGAEVVAGQPIGLGGNTGRTTGIHLHFEVHIDGRSINPEKLFDFENQCMKLVGKSSTKRLVFEEPAPAPKPRISEEVEEVKPELKPEPKNPDLKPEPKHREVQPEPVLEQPDIKRAIEPNGMAYHKGTSVRQPDSLAIQVFDTPAISYSTTNPETGINLTLPLSVSELTRSSNVPDASDVTFDSSSESAPEADPVVVEIIQPPPQPPQQLQPPENSG